MAVVIDTHCHLTRPEFVHRVNAVLRDAAADGVGAAITVATTTADAEAAQLLTSEHPALFASAGIHPLHAGDPIDWDQLRRASQGPKCVAWGELGLDMHYPTPDFATQERVLLDQLDHIRRWQAGAPARAIIVHCRKAFEPLLAVFRGCGLPPERFVFHCFSGGPSEARAVLDFGACISFTGILTYANAPEVREAAALAPLDRIMVETDSPYLSPEPHRRRWPNEPRHTMLVARTLAQVRGLDLATLEAALDANAARFFDPRLASHARGAGGAAP